MNVQKIQINVPKTAVTSLDHTLAAVTLVMFSIEMEECVMVMMIIII